MSNEVFLQNASFFQDFQSICTRLWHNLLPLNNSSIWLTLLISFIVYQFCILLLQRRYLHRTFERMGVKGPKPHLIHGQLYNSRQEPYVKYAAKLHKDYGKTVGIYLGADPYLLTTDLQLIQQVFVAKSRLFYDRMDFYLNVDPVPDNLICQRGERWRYMRRLLTPAFSHSRIRSSQFYRDTWQTVRKLMYQLNANATPELSTKSTSEIARFETLVEDSYDRMAAVALDVIVKTAFHMDNMVKFDGKLRNLQHGKLDKATQMQMEQSHDLFLETVKRACRLGFNPLVELIFCFPFLDKFLTFLCNKLYFSSILQLLYNRLEQLIRSNSSSQKEIDCNKTVLRKRRIVDSLVDVLREGKISRSEFTGNAFVIVFAGFETTANALTFTLWLLAQNQHVQKKLRLLLREKFPNSLECLKINTDIVTSLDASFNMQLVDLELAQLATEAPLYLEMVLNESLRLFPPVPGLSCRQASVGLTLQSGLRIEKGVNVIPSVFSIHRDPLHWGLDANEFRPERFEMLDESELNSAKFMPFGLGPRNCIGKALAMHEMKIAIGLLVLGYSIEPWLGKTPQKLQLCSPINITLTNSEKIALKFVKL